MCARARACVRVRGHSQQFLSVSVLVTVYDFLFQCWSQYTSFCFSVGHSQGVPVSVLVTVSEFLSVPVLVTVKEFLSVLGLDTVHECVFQCWSRLLPGSISPITVSRFAN